MLWILPLHIGLLWIALLWILPLWVGLLWILSLHIGLLWITLLRILSLWVGLLWILSLHIGLLWITLLLILSLCIGLLWITLLTGLSGLPAHLVQDIPYHAAQHATAQHGCHGVNACLAGITLLISLLWIVLSLLIPIALLHGGSCLLGCINDVFK